jgi:hypothetical protein
VFRIDARGLAFSSSRRPRATRDVSGHFQHDSAEGRREDGVRLRFLIILLATAAPLLLAVGVSGQARPGVPNSGFAPTALTQPPERSIVGTLEAVDPKTMQIVVSSPSGKQTLHLPTGATIRQGSKTVKASELPAHKGERVKVRYRESGGVQQAEWIVLASPPAKRPKHADEAAK